MKILNYIKGNRKGKEANRIERDALRDPFLSDALDGYNDVGSDHQKAIEALRRQVTRRTNRNNNYSWGWAAAIALLLSGGVVNYYFFTSEKVFVADHISEDFIPMIDSPSLNEVEAIAILTDSTPDKPELIAARPVTPPPPTPTEPATDDVALVVIEIISSERDEEILIPEPIEIKHISAAETKLLNKSAMPQTLLIQEEKQTENGIVKGFVTDNEGEPLVGATVSIKNSNKGVLTDINGYFELLAAIEEELNVNYIGFESLSIPIDSSTMMIAMHEDDRVLDEVTVVGFGKQSKSKILAEMDSTTVKKHLVPKPVIGEKEFNKYLKNELVHPTDSECAKKKGKVYVIFSVNNHGRPYNIRIKKGICSSIDREAIRLINEGPEWTTGTNEAEVTIRF